MLGVLGVAGESDRIGLGVDGLHRVAILLIDGMGADLVAARRDVAPFLGGRSERTLAAGFPSTTATSLASLGTGIPAGEHGIVGYLLAVPDHERLMNPLKWRLMGEGPKVDLLKEVVPEQFQPVATAFERAAVDGITMTQVAPMDQAGSPLTRAALRGGEFRPSFSSGDLVDGVVSALADGDRSLVYAYSTPSTAAAVRPRDTAPLRWSWSTRSTRSPMPNATPRWSGSRPGCANAIRMHRSSG